MVGFRLFSAHRRRRPDAPGPRRARRGPGATRVRASGAVALAVGAALAAAPTATATPSGAAHPLPGAATAPATASDTSAAGNSSYTAANLPDWAIGPFTRSADNPLLTPSGSGY